MLRLILYLPIEVERERKSSMDTTALETKSSAKSVVIYFMSTVLGLIEHIARVILILFRGEEGEEDDKEGFILKLYTPLRVSYPHS
tara:strand:+ start:204 stop:461 length:258 start_codon:yes stop_codon:yes gene_type:complete